jgi:hypothetical protein
MDFEITISGMHYYGLPGYMKIELLDQTKQNIQHLIDRMTPEERTRYEKNIQFALEKREKEKKLQKEHEEWRKKKLDIINDEMLKWESLSYIIREYESRRCFDTKLREFYIKFKGDSSEENQLKDIRSIYGELKSEMYRSKRKYEKAKSKLNV